MEYKDIYSNGLYSKHGESLEEFFKRLDENGGWPEGKSICYAWLNMRNPVEEVGFMDKEDGLNIMGRMIHSTVDQYLDYKNHS